jgi:hypothetical protein
MHQQDPPLLHRDLKVRASAQTDSRKLSPRTGREHPPRLALALQAL